MERNGMETEIETEIETDPETEFETGTETDPETKTETEPERQLTCTVPELNVAMDTYRICLLYTSPSPRDS